jgi:hypothetical protein
MKGSKAEWEAYALKMLVQGIKALYKVACIQAEGQRAAGPDMSQTYP